MRVSKTVGPGLRLGWLAPGRYRDQVMHMKYVSTGASATMPQLAVAEFVAKGHYERHLRYATRQCLRLNYAFTLTPANEDAVRTVGELACEMVEEALWHQVALQ